MTVTQMALTTSYQDVTAIGSSRQVLLSPGSDANAQIEIHANADGVEHGTFVIVTQLSGGGSNVILVDDASPFLRAFVSRGAIAGAVIYLTGRTSAGNASQVDIVATGAYTDVTTLQPGRWFCYYPATDGDPNLSVVLEAGYRSNSSDGGIGLARFSGRRAQRMFLPGNSSNFVRVRRLAGSLGSAVFKMTGFIAVG